MTNITLGGKQHNLTEEQVEKIKDMVEEDDSEKRWVPEDGDEYYHILNGKVARTQFTGRWDPDVDKVEIGNYYKTKEQAQKKVAELKAIESIRRAVSEEFGYDPAKLVPKKDKTQIHYHDTAGGFNTHIGCSATKIGKFKKDEDAQFVIDNFEEELRCIFGLNG